MELTLLENWLPQFHKSVGDDEHDTIFSNSLDAAYSRALWTDDLHLQRLSWRCIRVYSHVLYDSLRAKDRLKTLHLLLPDHFHVEFPAVHIRRVPNQSYWLR